MFALAVAMTGCHKTPSDDNTGFAAELNGDEQVPMVKTTASGSATFWLNPGGTELHYKLTVTDLNNVTMAHLHLGKVGKNGPSVAWLYPSAPPPKEITGPSNGVLSEGVITASDLTGPLEGKPIPDLVREILAQDIYVNVHTQDHGDGEIRGQLR